jgi:hypothetical protein
VPDFTRSPIHTTFEDAVRVLTALRFTVVNG